MRCRRRTASCSTRPAANAGWPASTTSSFATVEWSTPDPPRLVRFTHLRLSDFPTLADLLAKADHAEPDAVVDLHVDDSGVPSYLSIDHDPAAIDDEECYRVTGVRRLGE